MKKWRFFFGVLALSGTSMMALGDDLPDIPLLGEEPEVKIDDVIQRTRKPVDMTVETSGENNAIGVNFRLYNPSTLKFTIIGSDGRKKVFSARSQASSYSKDKDEKEFFKKRDPNKLEAPPTKFDNHVMNLQGLNISYFIRPNFTRYWSKYLDKNAHIWDREMPDALQKTVRLELLPDDKGYEIWLDGRYAGRQDGAPGVKSLNISGGSGPEITDFAPFHYEKSDRFLTMQPKYSARPGAMKEAVISLDKGLQNIGNIPIVVAGAGEVIDVGYAKRMRGIELLEVNQSLSRSAFDGMPESLHYSIPQDQYNKVYVLCAATAYAGENDKLNGVMNVRMTRWAGDGRSDNIANTPITLPRKADDPVDARLKKVGSVKYKLDGKEIEVPLFLAELDIRNGQILELVNEAGQDKFAPLKIGPYLDFEFWGRMGGVNNWADMRYQNDGSVSAVQVFGFTLEKSPIRMDLAPSQPGNIFHNDEEPKTTVVLTAARVGKGNLNYRIYDWQNKELKKVDIPVEFTKIGEVKKIDIPLNMPVGWYGLDFRLTDDKNNELMFHDAAFSILGKDTREAGYESPYGGWSHGGAHHTISDPKVLGPLFFKAGLRRLGGTAFTEAQLQEWKITTNQIPWGGSNIDLTDEVQSKRNIRMYIEETLEKFPHTNAILVFHESGPSNMAQEVVGKPSPEKTEASLAAAESFVKRATIIGEVVKQYFPQIKTVVGNSAGSSELIAILLRNGLNPEYIDYMGIETPAQTGLPEKLWTGGPQSAWICQETSKAIIGKKLPVSACYEYTCRCERVLGRLGGAQYQARDFLLSLAYEMPHIGAGGIEPAGNAYWQTLWGDGSYCRRNPLLYPKMGYQAIATLTKVLDKVKLLRKLDSGVLSNYILEFRRNRKQEDFAYALWTPRAECEIEISFPQGTKVESVGFFGESKKMELKDGKLKLVIGPSPCYLIADKTAESVKTVRHITEDIEKLYGGKFTVAEAMDDPGKIELFNDYGLQNPDGDMPMQVAGDFKMRQVKDEEKGNTVELELLGNQKLPQPVGEYVTMRFKNPVTVAGEPHTMGVWVKGNSGWGFVVFEFTDAEGEVYRTYAGYHDWPGHLSINFDGWHFIAYPITYESPIKNWFTPQSGGGNRRVDYPIKINALYLSQMRWALDPSEMKPVSPVVRFRDLGTIESVQK